MKTAGVFIKTSCYGYEDGTSSKDADGKVIEMMMKNLRVAPFCYSSKGKDNAVGKMAAGAKATGKSSSIRNKSSW